MGVGQKTTARKEGRKEGREIMEGMKIMEGRKEGERKIMEGGRKIMEGGRLRRERRREGRQGIELWKDLNEGGN